MISLRDPLTMPCGQVLPNRIMKAALSEGLSDKQNSPDERLERLYTSWSQGGYGLIVTGNVMVDRTQLGEPGNVVIDRLRRCRQDTAAVARLPRPRVGELVNGRTRG
jgi:2,4-dienoyl-CoA reductase-like NADH-dependent reductase (Old Yellow Enzyme family)